jgi:hypothetical protein
VRTATTAQEAMLASVGSDPYERIEELRANPRRKRDASMISKLYSNYSEQRDLRTEEQIRRLLTTSQ